MSKKPVQAQPETTVAIRPSKNPRVRRESTPLHSSRGSKTAARTSKSDQVLSLLKRAGGATLDDLMKVTHWQSHSVRGFLSGAVRKRMGLTIVSELNERGLRRYRIAGEAGA